MAAEDNLSKQLFHGTAHAFKPGEQIEPNSGLFKGMSGTAFATTDYESAKAYAEARAEREGTTHGMVYSVEPVDKDEASRINDNLGRQSVITSSKGFKVKKHDGWA
jgi:hypothetical protein